MYTHAHSTHTHALPCSDKYDDKELTYENHLLKHRNIVSTQLSHYYVDINYCYYECWTLYVWLSCVT